VSDQQPTDPREALNGTVWDLLRNAYVRAASGGKIPRSQADRNVLVGPFLGDMKQDYAALLACIDQGAIIEYQRLSDAQPPKPDDE